MFQKILVALDHSETSKHAFEQAMFLAKATQASLMLLNVVSPVGTEAGYPNLVFPIGDEVHLMAQTDTLQIYLQQWEAARQEDLARVKSCSEEANAAGIYTKDMQAVGDPAKQICLQARNWGADLIVMGRRGRSGLSELLLGSVSNYVTHHAHCSVLTVHLQDVQASSAATQA